MSYPRLLAFFRLVAESGTGLSMRLKVPIPPVIHVQSTEYVATVWQSLLGYNKPGDQSSPQSVLLHCPKGTLHSCLQYIQLESVQTDLHPAHQ